MQDLATIRSATACLTQVIRGMDADVVAVLALVLDILETLLLSDDWGMLELHQVSFAHNAALDPSFRVRVQAPQTVSTVLLETLPYLPLLYILNLKP